MVQGRRGRGASPDSRHERAQGAGGANSARPALVPTACLGEPWSFLLRTPGQHLAESPRRKGGAGKPGDRPIKSTLLELTETVADFTEQINK